MIRFNRFYTQFNILSSLLIIASLILLVSSCSKDSDNHTDCHECHIALLLDGGGEKAWDITAPDGGNEFCGDDLENAESNPYVLTEILVNEDGDTLFPGTYGVTGTNYQVHCEDHANHDH